MVNPTTMSKTPNPPPQRRTICSRIKQIFRGPQKNPTPGSHQEFREQDRHEKSDVPYHHIPTGASSSFLRTTTKTDMFELKGSRRNQPVSGEASVENLQRSQELEDLQISQALDNQQSDPRSESRLKHTKGLNQNDST